MSMPLQTHTAEVVHIHSRRKFSGCAGACHQGDWPCRHPDICLARVEAQQQPDAAHACSELLEDHALPDARATRIAHRVVVVLAAAFGSALAAALIVQLHGAAS